MFIWLRGKIELYRLDRAERKLEIEHRKKQAEAKEKDDPALLEDWELNYGDHVYSHIYFARAKMVSDALLREAGELHLPRPQRNDKSKWHEETDENGMPLGVFVLTAEAMTELRAAIRKEKKERREIYEWWVKLAGGILPILTGLVGALIGLASVLRHK